MCSDIPPNVKIDCDPELEAIKLRPSFTTRDFSHLLPRDFELMKNQVLLIDQNGMPVYTVIDGKPQGFEFTLIQPPTK